MPLLLIEALSEAGTLDKLLRDEENSPQDALARARTYMLIYALMCHLSQ